MGTEVQHRLNAQDHAGNELRTLTVLGEIRDIRRLMKPDAASMPHLFPYESEMRLLCDLLDRTRNILDISARMCRRKPRLQRFLRIFQKPCNVFRHILFISYVDSPRRISDSALERDSDVNADDIAFEDKAVMPPDSVDNLVIDGDADVSGITAIIQECGLSPHGADHFAGDIVKILGRHP